MIVNQARYSEGRRLPCEDISTELESIASAGSKDFIWVGMKDPGEEAFNHVISEELHLHPLAVEDAISGDQRTKVERYGDTWFVVLKPLRYVEQTSDIETGELNLFIGPSYIVTVRRGEASPLADLRRHLEADPEALRRGPWGVFHAILDSVVDEYLRIEDELQVDLDAIETGVFDPASTVSSEAIYNLKREVLEFKRAAVPLVRPLSHLVGPGSPVDDEDLRFHFRDVADHLNQVIDNTESQDRLLSDVLNAHLAQVGVTQNEDMRKISAWVAIAALPTMIAGIYGMNFEGMPELSASVQVSGREFYYGYFVVLALIVVACLSLYRLFKRSGWL